MGVEQKFKKEKVIISNSVLLVKKVTLQRQKHFLAGVWCGENINYRVKINNNKAISGRRREENNAKKRRRICACFQTAF